MTRSFLIVLFAVISLSTSAQSYSGGSGTSSDPYKIATKADLIELANRSNNGNDLGAYFIQTANITFNADETTEDWDGDGNADGSNTVGFDPIGDEANDGEFHGSYDGQSHYIENLYINSSNSNVGLFYQLDVNQGGGVDPIVQDLTLKAADIISSGNNVGGFSGYGVGARFENLHVDKDSRIEGNDDVGGIVGENINSSNTTNEVFKYCSFQGTVEATSNSSGGCGGIAGNSEVAIEESYFNGQVIGHQYVGGIAGELEDANLKNCFTIGQVTGHNDVGGLIGFADETNGSTYHISDSWSASLISRLSSSSSDEFAGLVGEHQQSNDDLYWIDLFGADQAHGPDEEQILDPNMKIVSPYNTFQDHDVSDLQGTNASSTLSNWDFTNIWQNGSGENPGHFPILQNVPAPASIPLAPVKFQLTPGNGQVDLSWTANVETDIAHYNIYRSTSGQDFTPSSGNKIATVTHGSGTLSYADNGVTNGTQYFYKITAEDNDGNESLPHLGVSLPAQNKATISVTLSDGTITTTDRHGDRSGDVQASYSANSEGHITNIHTLTSDGSGNDQGVPHDIDYTTSGSPTASLTVNPEGLQTGQTWYFYYDDDAIAGYPVRNTSGRAGTGTTLITGSGNSPVTIPFAGLDRFYTLYLFYVDPAPSNDNAPQISNLDNIEQSTATAILDGDLTISDADLDALNNGAGNYNGTILTLQRKGGANTNDVFAIQPPSNDYSITSGNILINSKQVATYTQSNGKLEINFSGTEIIVNKATLQEIVRHISYTNSASTLPGSVTLEWQFDDNFQGSGGNKTTTADQIINFKFIWNGGQSTSWSNGQNWDIESVPNHLAHTVEIPSRSNNPSIAANQSYSASDLTVDASAALTLETASNLTIGGSITNNGNLDIKDNASLVQTATSDNNTGSGNYTVSNEATYANQQAFKYWSSPVSGETFGDVFDNTNYGDAYNWNPGANNQSNWNSIDGSYTFEAGRGVITTPKPSSSASANAITETRTFDGDINNGTVTYNAGSLDADDYILAGNPYPSAIDNAKFVDDNGNLTGTLHYWNHTTFGGNNVTGDYATWNKTGSTTGNGSKTPSDYTAAMQGFFVEVDNAGSIDVTFENDQRVDGFNSQFFKTQEQRERLWLQARNDSGAVNQLLIGLVPGATDGYDRLYDGRKLKGNPHIAFYSILGSRDLAIQGLAPSLKRDKIIPLGLDAGQKGRYTIALDSLDNWPGHHLTLIDSAQGVITNLKNQDYDFAVNQTGPIRNRFYLALSADPFAGVGLREAGQGELLYFQRGGQLIIDSKLQRSALKKVSLRSLDGRLLLEAAPKGYRHQCAVNHLAAGVYLLEVRNQAGVETHHKVYLR